MKDLTTGDVWDIKAKVTVNATGPFVDHIRDMSFSNEEREKNPERTAPLVQPSAGVHIVLSDRYSPDGMGLIIPKTNDGR